MDGARDTDYPAAVGLNPVPQDQREYTASIRMMRQVMGEWMYPPTLDGLDREMGVLVK